MSASRSAFQTFLKRRRTRCTFGFSTNSKLNMNNESLIQLLTDSPREQWNVACDGYFKSSAYLPEEIKKITDSIKAEASRRKARSEFEPMTTKQLSETLGLTIKRDESNKIVCFLCQLSAFTEDSQINVSFNAPSSTGKSFIPLEIANLFPKEDVIQLASASPTSFYHKEGIYDTETNTMIVDLQRKILIFTEMPHTDLLVKMRPIFSHDSKESKGQYTDKNQRGGNRAKQVTILGFPSVIFCTAGLRFDEQEATRFLLLSPQVTQEKLREAIWETLLREADKTTYMATLNASPERNKLRDRIEAIKYEHIDHIRIPDPERLLERFKDGKRMLKPRHQRDIKRLCSLIKCVALLNCWWRQREGSDITANSEDIEEGFKLWQQIAASQELNLPPYLYDLYYDVIVKAYDEKNSGRNPDIAASTGRLGLSKAEISQKHYEVYDRMLDPEVMRQQVLPMLQSAGLIEIEKDENDKRKILIFPLNHSGQKLSTVAPQDTNNSDFFESLE